MVSCARLEEATARGAITWRVGSAQRPPDRVGSIGADQHDVTGVSGVDHAEHEDLALEATDPPWREVDHGEDGGTDEGLGCVAPGKLRARAQYADGLTEVHPELDGWLACFRERFR